MIDLHPCTLSTYVNEAPVAGEVPKIEYDIQTLHDILGIV